MKNNQKPAPEFVRLRRNAEAQLHEKMPAKSGASVNEELQRLNHELQVYQIELIMQNDELRLAQEETEKTLERLAELYDFAPVGYLSVDRNGLIIAANLASAQLLGEVRSRLVGRPFKFFVPSHKPQLHKLIEKAFAGHEKQSCEITIKPPGKEALQARLEAQSSRSGEECSLVVINLTDLCQGELFNHGQERREDSQRQGIL